MALEIEMDTYRKNLSNLLGQEGKFVLIHRDQIIGVYDSREQAIVEGYERVGLYTPFLTKQVQAVEKPIILHRYLVPSCHQSADQ